MRIPVCCSGASGQRKPLSSGTERRRTDSRLGPVPITISTLKNLCPFFSSKTIKTKDPKEQRFPKGLMLMEGKGESQRRSWKQMPHSSDNLGNTTLDQFCLAVHTCAFYLNLNLTLNLT